MRAATPLLRRTAVAVLAALALTIASGCGGGGDQTFNDPDYPFSFEYPSGWTLTQSAASNDEATSQQRGAVTVALKEPYDQVVLTEFKLKKKLPAKTNGYRPEVDRIVARLTKQAGGDASDGKVVKYGGLPGYQYVVSYKSGNTQLKNTLTFLFRGQSEFQIGCQSAPDQREELSKGCDQILDSLEFEDD